MKCLHLQTGRRPSGSRRAGLTLLEVLIGATVLLLLAGSLTTSLGNMKGLTTAGDTKSRLQEAGERILAQVVADMKRSGFDSQGGKDYPFLFDEGDAANNWQGVATAGFGVHTHVAPNHAAEPGDPDFGPTREIVFLQPQDADGDGVPDLDATGGLVWDARDFSYVLVTRPDGVNYLERRVDGGEARKVGMFVERIAFNDNASTMLTADPVPLGAVRVEVFLREQDESGMVHRYAARAEVRMRNATL